MHPYGTINLKEKQFLIKNRIEKLKKLLIKHKSVSAEHQAASKESHELVKTTLASIRTNSRVKIQRENLTETAEDYATLMREYSLYRTDMMKNESSMRVVHILRSIMTRMKLYNMNKKPEYEFKVVCYDNEQGKHLAIANSLYMLDVIRGAEGSLEAVHFLVGTEGQNDKIISDDLTDVLKYVQKCLLHFRKSQYDEFESICLAVLIQKLLLTEHNPAVLDQMNMALQQLLAKQIKVENPEQAIMQHLGLVHDKAEGKTSIYYKTQNYLSKSKSIDTTYAYQFVVEYKAIFSVELTSSKTLAPVLVFKPAIVLPLYICQQIHVHIHSHATKAFEFADDGIDLTQLLCSSTDSIISMQEKLLAFHYNTDASTRQHRYAVQVSRIPFVSVSQIPQVLQVIQQLLLIRIVQIIRQQLLLNDLLMSCFPTSAPIEQAPANTSHVDILWKPPFSLMYQTQQPDSFALLSGEVRITPQLTIEHIGNKTKYASLLQSYKNVPLFLFAQLQ